MIAETVDSNRPILVDGFLFPFQAISSHMARGSANQEKVITDWDASTSTPHCLIQAVIPILIVYWSSHSRHPVKHPGHRVLDRNHPNSQSGRSKHQCPHQQPHCVRGHNIWGPTRILFSSHILRIISMTSRVRSKPRLAGGVTIPARTAKPASYRRHLLFHLQLERRSANHGFHGLLTALRCVRSIES